jgi:alcohol dehydrogenase class IV
MVGFFTTPQIAWGTGALEQLSGLGARRAAVVIDPPLAALRPVRRVTEELERGGASVQVIADLPLTTRTDRVSELASRLRSADADWVVVVGGGTAIDAAKGARLLVERPDIDLERPPVDIGPPEPARTRLAAVPTTSGSGADASWTADLWSVDGAPFELAHRSLIPAWAIVDPAFPAGLPASAVATGALQTAAQACEAYLSAWANPFSDALAMDALGVVARRLPHALRWSDDPDARAALHYAATEAGLAQSNAQRGLAHALTRALVRPTGLDYATVLAVVLPGVLEFDRPATREKLEALALALRQRDDAATLPVVERLGRLSSTGGIPRTLAAAGANPATVRASCERVVAETLRSPAVLANPRIPSAEDVGQLVEAALGVQGVGPAA